MHISVVALDLLRFATGPFPLEVELAHIPSVVKPLVAACKLNWSVQIATFFSSPP